MAGMVVKADAVRIGGRREWAALRARRSRPAKVGRGENGLETGSSEPRHRRKAGYPPPSPAGSAGVSAM